MCMLFLFMIYYKCIFIRFHEDKYSMDFFKKKNIKKLKIINNKTINIIYAVLLFVKMNLTDEKSVFFMPFFKNKGGNKMEKEILKLLGEKDGEFFEGDVSGDTIILYSRIEKLFLKLQETIQKNVYELSDTTKKLIQNDAKIATNLYVIAAELIRWYSTKISDVANEKVVIDTAKWLRLSNRHFFDEYCDDKSLGSIFLQYVEKSDRNGQKKFVLYFFHILHYCPPNGFNEYMLNQNIGTNWYCKEK